MPLRRHAHLLRPAPRDRAHIGVDELVGLEHLVAGGVDLVDAPRDLEAEELGALVQPLAVLGELEDLAVVGALPLEHALA